MFNLNVNVESLYVQILEINDIYMFVFDCFDSKNSLNSSGSTKFIPYSFLNALPIWFYFQKIFVKFLYFYLLIHSVLKV
jgi:hypothetical protein